MFLTFLLGWWGLVCLGESCPLCLVLLPTFQYATLGIELEAKGLQNARYSKGFNNLRVAAILVSILKAQSAQV